MTLNLRLKSLPRNPKRMLRFPTLKKKNKQDTLQTLSGEVSFMIEATKAYAPQPGQPHRGLFYFLHAFAEVEMVQRIWLWACMVLLVPLVTVPGWCDESGDRSFNEAVTRPVEQAVKIRQATQKEEEKWREEQQKLVARYEKLQSERSRLQAEREALGQDIRDARGRIAEKERQLIDIDMMQARIKPFLQTSVADLRQMVEEDLPFLPEERRQRVDRLETLLKAPDVAISEKYRKVMEAWLVEAEYGQTIEVYQQTITAVHHEMLANIMRLGRVSLFYQALDQSSCGFFDVASRSWQPLPAADNRVISAAIDIGTKRKPAELLSLPLGRISVK